MYQKIINHMLIRQSNQLSEVYSQVVSLPAPQENALPTPTPTPNNDTAAALLPPPQTQPETPISRSMNDEAVAESNPEIITPPTHQTSASDLPAPSVISHTPKKTYPYLEKVLHENIKNIPECKTIAYVDTSNDELLAIEAFRPLPKGVSDYVALATADLFNAPNVIIVSNFFKEHKNTDRTKSNFHEIIVNGDTDTYVFLRSRAYENHIAVFAFFRDRISYGMILHHAYLLLPKIEEAMKTEIANQL